MTATEQEDEARRAVLRPCRANARRFVARGGRRPSIPSPTRTWRRGRCSNGGPRPSCAATPTAIQSRAVDRTFLEMVPGTKGQAHLTVEGGGHFSQEEEGVGLARVLNDFMARN